MPNPSWRASNGTMPTPGLMWTRTIFSGVFSATSSMSMPPAALAMMTGLPGRAIEDDAEIQLALHLEAFFDQHAPDDAPFGTGLVRDERHADHRARQLLRVLRRLRELDAAALAAAARVDLRLHDDNAGAEALGDVDGICGSEGHLAAGHGHAVSRKDRFRLVLVDFHIGRKETPDANLRLFMTQQ